MRAKLDRPDAAGMLDGGSPDRVSATSGMKKNAIATPCTTVGIRIVSRSAWVLKYERIQNTSANTPNATLASRRSEEHTSELQSLMRISYAVFCLKNKK